MTQLPENWIKDERYGRVLLLELQSLDSKLTLDGIGNLLGLQGKTVGRLTSGRRQLSYPEQLLLESMLPRLKVEQLRERWKHLPPRPVSYWDRITQEKSQ